ncbi:hypothetical protein BGZ60DRAFT_423704 [Tricladium varicosporioides]|nr:hypothetical protein BGZ60DRAFT_423704 [Hymenoscyphus varicosporioides]
MDPQDSTEKSSAEEPSSLSVAKPTSTEGSTLLSHQFSIDDWEKYLRARSRADPEYGRLLKAYIRLRHQPSGKLFNVLLAVRGCGLSQHPYRYFEYFNVEENTTFETCLSLLRTALIPAQEWPTQICILSNAIPAEIAPSDYSFASKVFASTKTRATRDEAPFLAILHVLEKEWQLSRVTLEQCVEDPGLPDQGAVDLPSQRKTPGFSLPEVGWKTTNLVWFRDINKYTQDLSVYVWQPHLQPIKGIGATVVIGPLHSKPRRILVVLKPSKQHPELLTGITDALYNAIPKSVEECDDTYIISTILSIYALLIRDTGSLLKRIYTEVEFLSLEGRKNPSVSKIHFVTYLEDCEKASALAISHAITLLRSISTAIEAQQSSAALECKLKEWCLTIESDLEYLLNRHSDVAIEITNLRKKVRAHLELRQIRLTRTLAILAAIYLPFTFVSGFYGMNVKDPLWPPLRNSTRRNDSTESSQVTTAAHSQRSLTYQFSVRDDSILATNNSTTNHSLALENQTIAIINAISSAGGHMFTFQSFLVVAFTVTISTIILPLLAGPAIRFSVRIVDNNKRHWPLLATIFFIAVTTVCRYFLTPLIYICLFGGPQGLLAVWNLYQARRFSRNKKRWIMFTALFTVSILYDCIAMSSYNFGWGAHSTPDGFWAGIYHGGYYQYIGLTGILPPVYLFFLGLIVDLTSLWTHKQGRLSRFFARYRKYFIWALAISWVAIAIPLVYVPSTKLLYIGGLAVALGLYGMDKLWSAFLEHEGRTKWTGFFVVQITCLVGDVYETHGLLLSLVPGIYLVVFAFFTNDQQLIMKYLPSWMNKRRSAVLPTAGSPPNPLNEAI